MPAVFQTGEIRGLVPILQTHRTRNAGVFMSITSRACLPGTQAVILAGGRGERLLPLTAGRPKPAIPFGGVFRIVDFTLSNCLNSNVGKVAVLTQYCHEELHTYIRQRWSQFWNTPGRDGQELRCLPPADGKRYRGTADAVFQNLPMILSNRAEYVLILSGDHVYEMDYRELLAQHVETAADVTIAAVEHPLKDAMHFGVVEVNADFRVMGFEEKPRNPSALPLRPDMALVSMGVYVFNRDVLARSLMENCESGFGYDFGHHVIPSLIDTARVYAYDFRDEVKESPRYWRDIGTIDSYYQASLDFVRPDTAADHFRNGWHSRQELPDEIATTVCGSAHVTHSVLSPGVRIEEGAYVEDSVLMPGVWVGRGARLHRVIVEEGVRIPADFHAGWDIERDRGHYSVSPSGVVVISETPRIAKQVMTGASPAFGYAKVSDTTRLEEAVSLFDGKKMRLVKRSVGRASA